MLPNLFDNLRYRVCGNISIYQIALKYSARTEANADEGKYGQL